VHFLFIYIVKAPFQNKSQVRETHTYPMTITPPVPWPTRTSVIIIKTFITERAY